MISQHGQLHIHDSISMSLLLTHVCNIYNLVVFSISLEQYDQIIIYNTYKSVKNNYTSVSSTKEKKVWALVNHQCIGLKPNQEVGRGRVHIGLNCGSMCTLCPNLQEVVGKALMPKYL